MQRYVTILRRVALYVCLFIYLSLLIYLLFLSHYRQSVQGMVSVNLLPFASILPYLSAFSGFHIGIITDNFFGNIFAFMPFGFLLSCLYIRVRSLKKIAMLSLLTSITVEIVQFVLSVGAMDIDDVMLNTTGGMIGYGLFQLMKRLLKIVKS